MTPSKHYDVTKEIIGGRLVRPSIEEIFVRRNDECCVVRVRFRCAQEKQNCMQAENMMCKYACSRLRIM
jgi:hypothetical protein